MLITDYFLGGYQPLLMFTVYGLLTLAGVDARLVASQLSGERIGRCGGDGSRRGCWPARSRRRCLFFVVTNFVTWLVTPWYPRTVAGLVAVLCQRNAVLPLYAGGRLGFATVLFGGYAIAQLLGRPVLRRDLVTSRVNNA